MSTLLNTGFFGLSVEEILLHMLNLCILFVAMSLLLYKPIKKIIDERRASFTRAEAEKNKILEEIEEGKRQSAEIIKNAHIAEEDIIKNAKIKTEKDRLEIIDKAKSKASVIIEKAQTDVNNQKLKINEELSTLVPDLAVEMASKILQREINKDDNDKIIKDIINNWKE